VIYMKFTHEDRFIIGLMGLWGFTDAVAPHYHYISIFDILMCIWVLYEVFITLKLNRNITSTMLSISIGFILYIAVRMAVITNFTDVKWDVLLAIGVSEGLWVNYLSFKSQKI